MLLNATSIAAGATFVIFNLQSRTVLDLIHGNEPPDYVTVTGYNSQDTNQQVGQNTSRNSIQWPRMLYSGLLSKWALWPQRVLCTPSKMRAMSLIISVTIVRTRIWVNISSVRYLLSSGMYQRRQMTLRYISRCSYILLNSYADLRWKNHQS